MSVKTKAQLISQNDNLITTNDNEEITGAVLNGHLKDFIDSFRIESTTGDSDFTLKSVELTANPSGTSLQVNIPDTPVYDVQIFVNGERFIIGESASDKFYFKDSTDTIVRTLGNIVQSDILHYNSTALTYTLDNTDKIILAYLIEN